MQPSAKNHPSQRTQPAPNRRESLVPALAVAAVAVAAVAAAVMVKRADIDAPRVAALEPSGSVRAQSGEVVKAPPLQAPSTRAMGAPAACGNCGVVERVVAVAEPDRKNPRRFQMHIRMDDGTLRTIEQRGALAAGSRVVVEGRSVKPIS